MLNRTETRTAIEAACNSLVVQEVVHDLLHVVDYTLQQVVDLLHAQGHQSAVATADAIILNGEPFPMDGSTWMEAGHQYSHYKQWWPMPDRI